VDRKTVCQVRGGGGIFTLENIISNRGALLSAQSGTKSAVGELTAEQREYVASKSKKYICEFNGGAWEESLAQGADKENDGVCFCPVGKNENSYGLCV